MGFVNKQSSKMQGRFVFGNRTGRTTVVDQDQKYENLVNARLRASTLTPPSTMMGHDSTS